VSAPALDSSRNPFELFTLGLGLLSGLPLLFGVPAPGSTNALLGPVLVHVWAWILVAGCATALIGVWWTWFGWCPWVRPTPGTGLLVERVGLVAVGVGTLIYAVAILAEAPGFRWLPAAIVAAYGLACWWRAFLIQRWIRAAISRRPQ
jgi:hypothetical protein